MTDVLDHPVWAALTGAHEHLGRRAGDAARYPSDVAPFAALRPDAGGRAWADLAAITGPGGVVATVGGAVTPSPDWAVLEVFAGVQLVDTALRAAPDPEAVPLGPADVDEMLDLVSRTEPGPFRRRTVELGAYLGIRREGRLVAMGGERFHPPGWTEISAVCTDPTHRGQGLATRIVRAVAAGIRARGETPFMHAAADNTTALRLYKSIGFSLRRDVTITVLKRHK
ncbi:GNAT family N-acetyltransferase [Phytohabitans sp. ZYX-F-186]|uniref:GNAT family N-acetyltransferase n=1 Tax=Phytohabitans maris TaxID=3071409 RepID=A0ABU0Z7T1_9ACTN|nr:GNAT family N-acetyltransferase [Phytohabitans sp. ZYX-F-186]MDQ7903103.1 GNAT family N-acetyltransferase [Phytohabitans sp. ZYX-F-186]